MLSSKDIKRSIAKLPPRPAPTRHLRKRARLGLRPTANDAANVTNTPRNNDNSISSLIPTSPYKPVSPIAFFHSRPMPHCSFVMPSLPRQPPPNPGPCCHSGEKPSRNKIKVRPLEGTLRKTVFDE